MAIENLSSRALEYKQKILSDEEVTLLVTRLRQSFGERLTGFVEGTLSIEDHVRYWAVSTRLAMLRGQREESIKQVAAALKVAQYRIKDLERDSPDAVQSEILVKYVQYLGLDAWFRKWAAANSDLWGRLQSAEQDT